MPAGTVFLYSIFELESGINVLILPRRPSYAKHGLEAGGDWVKIWGDLAVRPRRTHLKLNPLHWFLQFS